MRPDTWIMKSSPRYDRPICSDHNQAFIESLFQSEECIAIYLEDVVLDGGLQTVGFGGQCVEQWTCMLVVKASFKGPLLSPCKDIRFELYTTPPLSA